MAHVFIQWCLGTADQSSTDRVETLHLESNHRCMLTRPLHYALSNIADCTTVSAALKCCRAPGGCRLREVVHGPMKWVLASNYMLDMTWLLSACPHLISAGQLVIVHGERTPDRSFKPPSTPPPAPPPPWGLLPTSSWHIPWSTIQAFFVMLFTRAWLQIFRSSVLVW